MISKRIVECYIFLWIIILFPACLKSKRTREKEYWQPVTTNTVLKYEDSLENILSGKVDDGAIYPAVINYKNREWFCMLSMRNDHLFLFNVQDIRQIDSIRINIPDTTIRRAVFLIKDQSLIVHEPFRSQYAVYNWVGDSLVLKRKIDLPAFAWKRYYMDYGTRACLQGISAPLVYSYGKQEKTKKYDYLDPEHNLVIFAPGDSSYKKIGHYPIDFFDHRIYNSNTLLCTDSSNNIFYTFQMHDSIYKMDKEGRMIATGVLHKNPDFDLFNWKKVMDLSYVRKHTLISEMNLGMCTTPNGNIVVIKQLHKKEYRDRSYYKYFVLDANLKMKYADTLRSGFFAGLLFPYKKGFIVFGNPGNKAVYYGTD